MNEIQVRVKYSSPPAFIALRLLLFCIPVWGVGCPILFLTLLCAAIVQPSVLLNDPFKFLAIVGGLLVNTCVSALACIALADDRLLAGKEGLRIPFHASLPARMQRNFFWDEITNVVFSGDTDSVSCEFVIMFKTNSGSQVTVDARKLSAPDLEKLLLALELWVDAVKVDERLPKIKEHLQHRLCLEDSQKQSYTTMWEEEMERHFASTAFVVLEPDAGLQDGRLKVVRQLSFGGLSAVYLCQRDRRELVVLKESVVPADAGDELRQKAEEMFAREARLLMRLNHPHIVGVLDYFVEKGRNYLLLEHVNGPDLNEYVHQHGAQREYKVIEWARKLAGVLEYLHGQEPPILHRDLSPDNIVLEDNHSVKIIDFGAANEFIGTATGTLVGKQSYLPMEQLRGKTVPQSDIYAFGGTLHFLLTGENPEPLAVSHPRASRPEVSAWLDDLVAACTAPDYRQRPQNAGVLSDALRRGDAVQAEP